MVRSLPAERHFVAALRSRASMPLLVHHTDLADHRVSDEHVGRGVVGQLDGSGVEPAYGAVRSGPLAPGAEPCAESAMKTFPVPRGREAAVGKIDACVL